MEECFIPEAEIDPKLKQFMESHQEEIREKIIEVGKKYSHSSDKFAKIVWDMLESKYPEETAEIKEAKEFSFRIVEVIIEYIIAVLQYEDKLVTHKLIDLTPTFKTKQ